MRSGDRVVVGLFAAAVAALLGALAWLLLRNEPTAPKPAPAVVAARPVPPPPKIPDPAKGEPDRSRQKSPVRYEVTGEVQNPDGSPAAGAEVLVLDAAQDPPMLAPASPSTDSGRFPVEHLREVFGIEPEEAAAAAIYTGLPALPEKDFQGKVHSRGESGADGKFRVETLSRGPFRLEARKEGVGHAVAPNIAAGGDPVVLRLGAAATLAGRVVKADGGAGIEGAVLVIRAGGVAKDARSGADGAFSIPDLPPGRYHLVAGATGFAPTVLPSVDIPPAEPLEIVLGGGNAIRINVTRYEKPTLEMLKARGKGPRPPGPPVEGAAVVLYHSDTDTYRTAFTGTDGTVRVDRLGDGKWRLGARKEGFNVGGCVDVRFKPGGPTEESREIRLYPEIVTPVRVTDESGAPVRNARVFTGGLDEDFDEKHSKLIGRTDADGRIQYAFDETVTWKSVLWIVPEEGGGAATRLEPEDAGSGEEESIVVRPGRAVHGTVTDGKGRPLKDAKVYLEVVDEEAGIDLALYAYTDAKGAYRFPSVPFGETTLEADFDGETADAEADFDNREDPLVRDFKIAGEEDE